MANYVPPKGTKKGKKKKDPNAPKRGRVPFALRSSNSELLEHHLNFSNNLTDSRSLSLHLQL